MVNIQSLQDGVKKFAVKHNISLIVLFGSQATGKTHAQSDVDIGFLSDRRLSYHEQSEMGFELSRSSKIGNIELLDLREAPPLLLKHVARDGKLIYERELKNFSFFKIYALKRYMEAKPLLRLREASLKMFLYAR